MRKLVAMLFTLAGLGLTAFSQPYHQRINPDFVVVKNEVWFLQSDSSLKVFDANTGRRIPIKTKEDFKIFGITKDYTDAIIAFHDRNVVSRLNIKALQWTYIAKRDSDELYKALFNSKNECFLITSSGIIEAKTGKKYFPTSYHHYRLGYKFNDWVHINAPVAFMDHDDNLWVDIEHGEWGGDIHTFNTITRQFIKRDTGAHFIVPIISYCQDRKNVFVAAGKYGGGIFKCNQITERDTTYINSQIIYNTDNNAPDTTSMYDNGLHDFLRSQIGCIRYNDDDKNLYLSCYSGLYKGDVNGPLNNIDHWKKIKKFFLKPEMRPEVSEPAPFKPEKRKGSPVPEGKFFFAENGKLIMLSFGTLYLFDGNQITKLE